jgi:ribosomal protein S18 acetylase RimI-like enzyme
VEARECRERDLPALQRRLPLPGEFGHAHRLRGQVAGRWTYLLAVDEDEPVGCCLVHWGGPTDDGVRARLPQCVDVTSAFVLPAARGRGAGTALLAAAEQLAVARDRHVIGLGVDDDNHAARRLYERRGYRDVGIRYLSSYDYVDECGRTQHAEEAGDYLVKELPGSRRPLPRTGPAPPASGP